MRLKTYSNWYSNHTWANDSSEFVVDFNESKLHLLFPCFCFVLYVVKVIKVSYPHAITSNVVECVCLTGCPQNVEYFQKFKFSTVRPFHILMYISIVLTTFCISLAKHKASFAVLNISYLLSYIPIFGNSFYILFILFFQLTANNEYFAVDRKRSRISATLILVIGRALTVSRIVALEFNGTRIEFDFFELLLLLIEFLLLPGFPRNAENYVVYVNCVVYLMFFLLSHAATIFLSLFLTELPHSFGGYASNVYYFPFLWIISIWVADSREFPEKDDKSPVQNVAEFQFAHIVVEKNQNHC